MNTIVKVAIVGAFIGGIALAAQKFMEEPQFTTVQVTVPTLSTIAQNGSKVYERACAECHGQNASGGPKGPPLIHKIYEPNHHGDQAFAGAILYGAKQHHWPYGNMEPVKGVSNQEIGFLIRYIREVQKANGIF